MKGKKIYVVDEARIKKHKRDTYLWLGGGLIFIFLFDFLTSISDGMKSLFFYVDENNIKLFFAAWGMVFSLLCVILWAGVRVQAFGIYERGIVPPLKPWRKMFSKEYFIPYERMERIDTDSWKIIEKGGRKSGLRSWFLFNFVRSGKEADSVEKMLKKIAQLVNERKIKEIREEELER